jgi:formylglycine-generating enzyme required for sulfatase activity
MVAFPRVGKAPFAMTVIYGTPAEKKTMQSGLIMMMVTAAFATCLGCTKAVKSQGGKEITNSIGMKLVLIPKGTFQMGSPPSENGSEDNERQHEVTLTRDYYIGAFEVTQSQYEKVMGKNPSYFQGDKIAERHPQTNRVVKEVDSSNHPVEQVSWKDAVEFCQKLSELPEEKAAGRVYRLPTEAEWEYACRAGSKSAYSFGDERDSLDDYAWYGENGDGKTHPVGQKKPNAWGLYDMHGNVWEWCSDWYGDYPKGAVSDPVGPRGGSGRVGRGGSWDGEAANCRSADRGGDIPSDRYDSNGFRVALSSQGIPK